MSSVSAQPQIVDADPTTLSWLGGIVREVLRLPESEEVDTRTLGELGAGSLQVVALQFRVLRESAVNVEIGELVGDSPVADLAALIDARRPPTR